MSQRDYDVLLHQTGAAPPSQALALAHPGVHATHATPPVHDARMHDPRELTRLQHEVISMRQQIAQMQAPPPAHHHAPQGYAPSPHHHGHAAPSHGYSAFGHDGTAAHAHHLAQQAEYGTRPPGRSVAGPHATLAQKLRHFPIGFVKAGVGAGQLAEIEVKPQVRFQGHRLAVAQSSARFFNIVDIKVGKDSQLAATGEMPAEAFSSLSVGTQMELDPAPPGIVIVLIVRNTWNAARDFGAVLYGTVEEGDG